MNNEEKSLVRQTEVKRNEDWPELDLPYIYGKVNGYNKYEYVMIMNTCKTNEMAIDAIKNKRKSDKEFKEKIKSYSGNCYDASKGYYDVSKK